MIHQEGRDRAPALPSSPPRSFKHTTMTIRRHTELIRRLLATFIDHPNQLDIALKEHPGVIYWTMRPHADDFGKMSGKQGSHFNALRLLITELGRDTDTQYVLRRYLEPDPAPRREFTAKRHPHTYDPAPADHLLTEILLELSIGQFLVEVKEAERFDYLLNIVTRAPEDYARLTVPRPDEPSQMTTIGALGTLFRAYANRDGVHFTLQVEQAKAS